MDNQLSVFSLNTLSKQKAETEIMALNEKTEQYGLTLTPQDVKALLQTRSEELTANGWVEVGGGILPRIIEAFCDSSFIDQRNYVETMQELLRIFYFAKSILMDRISDDELIDYMKDSFENRCMGSLELLRGRELKHLAEKLNCWNKTHMRRRGYGYRRDYEYWDNEREEEAQYLYERDDWYER